MKILTEMQMRLLNSDKWMHADADADSVPLSLVFYSSSCYCSFCQAPLYLPDNKETDDEERETKCPATPVQQDLAVIHPSLASCQIIHVSL